MTACSTINYNSWMCEWTTKEQTVENLFIRYYTFEGESGQTTTDNFTESEAANDENDKNVLTDTDCVDVVIFRLTADCTSMFSKYDNLISHTAEGIHKLRSEKFSMQDRALKMEV